MEATSFKRMSSDKQPHLQGTSNFQFHTFGLFGL